jgi:hypothetical protein
MNYNEIFEKYLTKLELHKEWKLGQIFKALENNKEPVDIVFLFLYFRTHEKFKTTIVSQVIEDMIVVRILN